MVIRETHVSRPLSSVSSICQTCVVRPVWTGRAIPVTQPSVTLRKWFALMSRPSARWPGGDAQAAPQDPSVSASSTEMPPCRMPRGCRVRASTGARARMKSSPTSRNSIPRWATAVLTWMAVRCSMEMGCFQIGFRTRSHVLGKCCLLPYSQQRITLRLSRARVATAVRSEGRSRASAPSGC